MQLAMDVGGSIQGWIKSANSFPSGRDLDNPAHDHHDPLPTLLDCLRLFD